MGGKFAKDCPWSAKQRWMSCKAALMTVGLSAGKSGLFCIIMAVNSILANRKQSHAAQGYRSSARRSVQAITRRRLRRVSSGMGP